MTKGLQQYQELVVQAWNKGISYYVPSEVYVAKDIDDLQSKTSKEFFGTSRIYPRAIALTETKNLGYFHPIVLVGETYSLGDLRGRELLKAAVLKNWWLADGMASIKFADHPVNRYLLVKNSRLYSKEGLSDDEQNELADFVNKIAHCSQVFSSSDFLDRDREIVRQADLIGKGYARELESRLKDEVGASGIGKKMAEYKWKTTIEGTIRIESAPEREPPCLNDTLGSIKYQINLNNTEIELRRYAESLFGKYSQKGRYTLRKHNDRFGWQDLEITGKELRENMNYLIREIKECWAAGNTCPTHLNHSRNFWANGDLELLEEILKHEDGLPEKVREMLADLAGVEYIGK